MSGAQFAPELESVADSAGFGAWVNDALRREGVEDGTVVQVAGYEFEFEDED